MIEFLDGPWPDVLRYLVSGWFAIVAAYLLWCGHQLRKEQDAADEITHRLTGGLPPALTIAEPPPAPGLLPRQANDGKQLTAGGISHPERLRLERLT